MKNVSTFKTRATMNPVHKHDLSRVCAICLSDVRHLSIFIGACWIVRNFLTMAPLEGSRAFKGLAILQFLLSKTLSAKFISLSLMPN
jgi:hypothetical protein